MNYHRFHFLNIEIPKSKCNMIVIQPDNYDKKDYNWSIRWYFTQYDIKADMRINVKQSNLKRAEPNFWDRKRLVSWYGVARLLYVFHLGIKQNCCKSACELWSNASSLLVFYCTQSQTACLFILFFFFQNSQFNI